MIAVIKTGGKQYSVKTGQVLKVEKINGKKGDNVSLNNVLTISDLSKHTIGDPIIKGASVEATILEQIRDKKIIVFKKRRRQNYRSTQGHRQYLTVLKIQSILHNGKKLNTEKKEKNKVKELKNTEEKKVTKKTSSSKKTVVKKTIKKKKSSNKKNKAKE